MNRVQLLSDHVNALNKQDVRYTKFYTLAAENLKETTGEHVELRRAKAEAYLLRQAPVVIHPYEPIVGSMTAYCPPMENPPTYDQQLAKAIAVLDGFLAEKRGGKEEKSQNRNQVKTFEDEFTKKKSRWALMSRVHHDADISYSNMQKIIQEMKVHYAGQADLEPYEIGRELERAFKVSYGEAKAAVDSVPWFAGNHLNYNYASMMNQGFDSRLAQLDALLETATGDSLRFYTASKIVTEATADFFIRHSEAALEAAQAADPVRKAELEEIGAMLKELAHRPAETFYEGVQFLWLLHMAASYLWGSALSFGRFDQYMYPLYAKSLADGSITEEKAEELLCCLWLKINEPKLRTVQSMTVGGVTPGGEDAVNPLTYLTLKVTGRMKLPYPNLGARLNKVNGHDYLEAVTDCINMGAGMPMVLSDDTWIANLKRLGYTDEVANDYYNMGCVEIMVGGCQPNWGVTDPIAFPMLLEPVFQKVRSGEINPATYEEFREEYMKVALEAVEADYQEALAKQADIPGKCYEPFGSMMIDGCLESGKDMLQDGAKLGTHWSFYAYGLGTVADAMVAVKKAVYEEKTLTLIQLADILHNNYENEETLRIALSYSMPHYGNDDDSVDLEGKYILKAFDDGVLAYNKPENRDKYVTTMFGYFFHIYHGEITEATPNGRKRGETLSDSMGPSQGKDISGPTKMLNSVLKLDHTGVTGGYALNLKINKEHVEGTRGKAILNGLLQTYFEEGGPQIQIVFLDVETLRKAQEEPEAYGNVVVRIGGYCEYFVNLDRSLQDEIIQRTMHE